MSQKRNIALNIFNYSLTCRKQVIWLQSIYNFKGIKNKEGQKLLFHFFASQKKRAEKIKIRKVLEKIKNTQKSCRKNGI